jgi:Bacterial regulatory proteins, lacI family
MHQTPTISGVARLARVSRTMVSRVINSTVHVSPEATQRVRAAIQDLGYSPNEIRRLFRSRLSCTTGLIIPYLQNLPLASCAHAMAAAVRRYNHSFVVAVSSEDPGAEFIEAELMLQRGVDGIAIISGRFHESRIACHFAGKRPAVVFDRSPYCVGEDGRLVQCNSGAQSIAEQLHSRRRQSVGLLRRSWRLYRMREEPRGYYMTIREGGKRRCSCMDCRLRHCTASPPLDSPAAGSEHATFFSSNFEPTHLSFGKLRRNELPSGLHGSCDPVQVSRTESAEVCMLAQDMGQIAASLLLERIAPWSRSRGQCRWKQDQQGCSTERYPESGRPDAERSMLRRIECRVPD